MGESILPMFPVKVSPDVPDHPNCREVWNHPQAKVLMLLWRPRHIITEGYWEETLWIGKKIAEKKPETVEELRECFPKELMYHVKNYCDRDVEEFVEEALPFFTGEQEVEFVIEEKG